MKQEINSLNFLKQLFHSAVQRVDPYAMVLDRISLSDSAVLSVRGAGNSSSNLTVNLKAYTRILVVGAGKASAPMAKALEEVLGRQDQKQRQVARSQKKEQWNIDGLVSVKYGHTVPTERIRIMEAGHPVPDANSIAAGEEIASLVQKADAQTLVIAVISGGGSALLTRPYPGIDYPDIQTMTALLLESGANIHEINTIRKHTSGIKGGRLAELAHPARLLSIILSDVVGDNLEVIASGPTVPDRSSFVDVWAIIGKYALEERLPDSIRSHFLQGKADVRLETPKPSALFFKAAQTVLLGNNRSALKSASDYARSMGYEVLILTSVLTGEAREVARVFAAIALDPPRRNLCILAGGETTVTIRGKGKGGRNQELALAYLCCVLEHIPESTGNGETVGGTIPEGGTTDISSPRAFFLAAGSDGNDGPTDAAGAIICPQDIIRIRQDQPNSSPESYLANNNAYEYLSKEGLIFKTGPTHTNVCDFCFLYIP